MVAVQVKAGSDEFTTVEKHLKATAQNMVNSIVKVFVFLFYLFMLLMRLVVQKNGGTGVGEPS